MPRKSLLRPAQHTAAGLLLVCDVQLAIPSECTGLALVMLSGDALAWLALYTDFVELMAAPIDGQTLFPDEPMGFWKREV